MRWKWPIAHKKKKKQQSTPQLKGFTENKWDAGAFFTILLSLPSVQTKNKAAA